MDRVRGERGQAHRDVLGTVVAGRRVAHPLAAAHEYTVVLAGTLHIDHEGGALDVSAGQGVLVRGGEWVRYSTPGDDGAEYIAVCLPAFSPNTVHRDDD